MSRGVNIERRVRETYQAVVEDGDADHFGELDWWAERDGLVRVCELCKGVTCDSMRVYP
jgi:hypothetical protein